MKKISVSLKVLLMCLSTAALAACATRPGYTHLYGSPVPAAAWADRTIVIRPDTRHINVEGGQTVKFIVGEKSFGWHFMAARTVTNFDLKEIAPPDMLEHSVIAYVSPDPRYITAP
jgi:hypothetical protein